MTPGPPPSFGTDRRRFLLLGSVGIAAMAGGCDLLDDASEDRNGPPPDPDGDDQLAARVALSLAEAAALGEATSERHPPLASLTGPFVDLHRTHGAMVGGLPDVAVPPVPGRRPRARAQFLGAETQLQQDLVEAALAAESGALAQAFAAMAAAVAQRQAIA